MNVDVSGMIAAVNRRGPCKVRVALFCATVVLFAVCLVQAADGQALIAERCLGCHGVEKNCEISVNDPDWWKETVLRMVEYKSGLLNDGEVDEVSLFLADDRQRSTLCSVN